MKIAVILIIVIVVLAAAASLMGMFERPSPTPTPTPTTIVPPTPTPIPVPTTAPPLEKITVEELLKRYYNSENLAGRRFQTSITVYASPDVKIGRVVGIARWESNPVWFFLYFRNAAELEMVKPGDTLTFRGEFVNGGTTVVDGRYGAGINFKNCLIVR